MNILAKALINQATKLFLKELGATALVAGVAAGASVVGAYLAERAINKLHPEEDDECCEAPQGDEGQIISLGDLMGSPEQEEKHCCHPNIVINVQSNNQERGCSCCDNDNLEMVESHDEDCGCDRCDRN